MEIVRIGGEDWETLRVVRLAALNEAPYAFGSTYEQEVDQTETDWRRWIAPDDPDSAMFLAKEGGDPVGMVAGYKEDDTTAHLIAMWVAPAVRGRSVGMALVNAVLDWARERGFETVKLDVAEDNLAAINLYRKMRFEPTGQSRPMPSAPSRLISEYALQVE